MTKQSKATTSSFRINIPVTPSWKIKSIANFKARREIKSKQASLAGKETGKNQIKSGPSKPTESTSSPLVLPPLKVVLNELGKLNKEENELKNEIQQLHEMKTSLIWMLRKGALHDTYRNHSYSDSK